MAESNRPKVFNLKFISYLKTLVKKGEWVKFREEAGKRWDKAKKAGIVIFLLFILPFPIFAKTRYVITLKETSRVTADNTVGGQRVIRSPAGSGSGSLVESEKPTPAAKREKSFNRQATRATLTPYPKFLTEKGAKTREKVLAHLSKYYEGQELLAADNILKKEAGYQYDIVNSAGAGGLPQALPYTKMGCPLTEEGIECQTQWFIGYVNRRYGTPLEAWNFHLKNNWY